MLGHFELEPGSEGECLSHRECGKEDIILHHIGSVPLETLLINWHFIIEQNVARQPGVCRRCDSVGENVEEGGLACTRGTHDKGRLAWGREPRHTLHDLKSLSGASTSRFLSWRTLDLGFKPDILPSELNGLLAPLFGRLYELDWVYVSSSSQGHATNAHGFGVLGRGFLVIQVARIRDVTRRRQ